MRSCSCHEGGKLGLPALVRAVACFTALPLTLEPSARAVPTLVEQVEG